MPLKRLKAFGHWIGKQADGFMRGVMRLGSSTSNVSLPFDFRGVLAWFVRSASWAFGSSTPIKQITASVALGIFALFTSWITLGATLVLVVVFALTAVVGFMRLVPVVDRVFTDARGVVIPKS